VGPTAHRPVIPLGRAALRAVAVRVAALLASGLGAAPLPVAAEPEAPPPLPDRGIFADLDSRVRISPPSWVGPPTALLLDRSTGLRWLLQGSTPVGTAGAGVVAPTVEVPSLAGLDADGDGLPDPVDLLIGARKTALDGAPYRGGYRSLTFPGGDVPRTEGVCTDVVIRAARNAGLDLQVLLHRDIRHRPRAYPWIARPDPNIDQRRVRTLLPYLLAAWSSRSTDPRFDPGDWLPGDVVLMDTLRGPEPDHIGVISDRLAPSGLPGVINSWTDSYVTAEMDLLPSIRVTHRFRVPGKLTAAPATARGAEGVLDRAGWTVPADSRQLLLVVAAHVGSPAGELRRYARRTREQPWEQVGQVVPVELGRSGLGLGRGLLPALPWRGPVKREGDGRSPAGVFRLGPAFGKGRPPAGGSWPWERVGPRDCWVDDPASPAYNQRARWPPPPARPPWSSAEVLARQDGLYEPALVVCHNDAPVVPGAGSAIFLHVSAGPTTPTDGCTALPRRDLLTLLGWLDPRASPVLVQTVGVVF